MAVTRAQRMRLGVFVAVGTIALVGGLVVLAGMKLGEKRDRYEVRFAEAGGSLSGLDVGSPVKYSGIRVGRVEKIYVDPKDVSVLVVQLVLDGGTPVAEDSVASAGSLGITGLKYIELSRGSRGARVRTPGEVIPSGQSAIDELTDRAEAISRKLDVLVGNLNAFTTPDMRAKAALLLDNANRLLSTAEATVAENRGNLQALTQRIAQASVQAEALTRELAGTAQRANALIDVAQPQIQALLGQATGLVTELRASRERLDLALVQAQGALGEDGARKTLRQVDRLAERSYLLVAQSQEEIDQALVNLRETSENLNAFSQRIKEDPSLLLGGGEKGSGRTEAE